MSRTVPPGMKRPGLGLALIRDTNDNLAGDGRSLEDRTRWVGKHQGRDHKVRRLASVGMVNTVISQDSATYYYYSLVDSVPYYLPSK